MVAGTSMWGKAAIGAIIPMLYVCQAMSSISADECEHEVVAHLQEMVVLIAAFVLGWYLFSRLTAFITSSRLEAAATASLSPAPVESSSSSADSEPSSPLPSGASRGSRSPEKCSQGCVHLSLARWLAKQKDFLSSQNCLEEVRKAGGQVDLRTYRALLAAGAKAGDMELATNCFQSLVSDGLEPDFVIFSCMIRGLCNIGRTEEAMTHFQLMLKQSVRPDALLFDAMLESCASRNLLSTAEQVLATMEELNVQPSNCTLAACIKLYSSRGLLTRAMAVFDEMPHKYDFEPNAYVYGTAIAACYRHGRSDLALKTYSRMSATGCCPNAHTYECLVRSCLQTGSLAEAIMLIDRALCLRPVSEGEHRTFVEPQLVEDLISLLGRRQQATALAIPLLERLKNAEFDISEEVSRGIYRAAAKEASLQSSMTAKMRERRAKFDHWRDFPSG